MSDSKDAFSHSNLNSKVHPDDLNTTRAIDEKLQSQVSLRAAITALDDDLQTFGINLSEETLHQTVAGLSLVTLRGALIRERLKSLLSAKLEFRGVAENYLLASLEDSFNDLCEHYPDLLNPSMIDSAAHKISELTRWADQTISIEGETFNALAIYTQLKQDTAHLLTGLQPESEKNEGLDHIQASQQLVVKLRQQAKVLESGLFQIWSELGPERESLQATGIRFAENGLFSKTEALPEFEVFSSEIAAVLNHLERCEQILKEHEATWSADKELLEKALAHLGAGEVAQAESAQALLSKRNWRDLDAARLSAALQSELTRLLNEIDALATRKKLQALEFVSELLPKFDEKLTISRQLKERHLTLTTELQEVTKQREMAELRAQKVRKKTRFVAATTLVASVTGTLLFQQHAATLRLEKAQVMMEKWRGETAEEEAAFFQQNFKRIPAGSFEMGAAEESDAPVHTVKLKAFSIAETELTYGEWSKVRSWAEPFSYEFDQVGEGRGEEHPVTNVSWYDAVKYCNAKSERAGLKPCYYTGKGRAFADVYRAGRKNLTELMVDWGADGYRLPTEAEWEKAARGGVNGQRYPSGVNLSKDEANYDDAKGGTKKVKSYPPNNFGLYDMAGNVWEWCWDWYESGYAGSNVTPHGPENGDFRVVRGGGWSNHIEFCRVAYRDNYGPRGANGLNGIRLVRN